MTKLFVRKETKVKDKISVIYPHKDKINKIQSQYLFSLYATR
jgi:hypothetical protein